MAHVCLQKCIACYDDDSKSDSCHIITDDQTDTHVACSTCTPAGQNDSDKVTTTLYVCVRGTDSATDILYDLSIWQQPLPDAEEDGVLVHAGFLACAQRVRQTVSDWLSSQISALPSKHNVVVQFCGHSLGAAVATILSILLEENLFGYGNVRLVACVSFGSPRVGNHTFMKYYNQRVCHIRYVTTNDIIACVPCINYYHVGTAVHLRCDSDNGGIFNIPNLSSHTLEAYKKEIKWLPLATGFPTGPVKLA